MSHKFSMAIHGGAGSFKKDLSPEREQLFKEALTEALMVGQKILSTGGSAIDAVEEAVKKLEDCPLFNAGKGSVFNHEGKIEMDAAIMDGRDLSAGSAAFITNVKNPISLARAIKERSEHVMLAGGGAEKFAVEIGMEIVDPEYFFTQHRWDSWQKLKNEDTTEFNLGTVGAVALDKHQNLAAATSTGGMTNKKYGRIGDSPILGAGVYANNKTCAVSSTGHGEYFIRTNAAHDISCLMEYKHMSLEGAANEVIKKLTQLGGSGGVIAVDKDGHITMPFSTETMFRGFIREDGIPHPFIFDTYSKIL